MIHYTTTREFKKADLSLEELANELKHRYPKIYLIEKKSGCIIISQKKGISTHSFGEDNRKRFNFFDQVEISIIESNPQVKIRFNFFKLILNSLLFFSIINLLSWYLVEVYALEFFITVNVMISISLLICSIISYNRHMLIIESICDKE